MNIMPEKPNYGVPASGFSATISHGKKVHTGGVTGSIPVAPTSKTATFFHEK
jgi:hypothetical protein